jgi:alkaline phosphatase
MIPVLAYGCGAEAFAGIYQNTAIFDKIVKALFTP